jgi:hypothetical protein
MQADEGLPDLALTALGFTLLSNNDKLGPEEDLPTRLALAAFAHGMFIGILLGLDDPVGRKRHGRLLAQRAARAKLRNDPKQQAKQRVHEMWRDWQSGKTEFKSTAAFAEAVLAEIPVLTSDKKIADWVRQWRRGAAREQQR